MISFCVRVVPVSRTLMTSFADGGRRSILGDTEFSGLLPVKAKTIPHGMFHHTYMDLTIVKSFDGGKLMLRKQGIAFRILPWCVSFSANG